MNYGKIYGCRLQAVQAGKAKALPEGRPVLYGMQLREKQKARRFYGLLEGQFEKYYEMAVKQPGIAGENLLRILESRLDNVIYRLGFAMARPAARQRVRHGHFTVDGKNGK